MIKINNHVVFQYPVTGLHQSPCTLYRLQCTLYNAHYTEGARTAHGPFTLVTQLSQNCNEAKINSQLKKNINSVCTPYIVHCTPYIVHCTTYIVRRTLYTVRRTLYNVRRKLKQYTRECERTNYDCIYIT